MRRSGYVAVGKSRWPQAVASHPRRARKRSNDRVISLRPGGNGPVLELGSGTGDLTLGLAEHVDHADAVEPSGAMLSIARRHSDIGWSGAS
jgi:ubiquinone/menaquinone biosynthesis C-methylase UbiE